MASDNIYSVPEFQLKNFYSTNIEAGCTPVASGWDTPPSSLDKMVDGDPNTVTGDGADSPSDGTIKIDLLYVYRVTNIRLKYSGTTQIGAASILRGYWYVSEDDVTWHNFYTGNLNQSSFSHDGVHDVYRRARYVKFQLYQCGSSTINAIRFNLVSINGWRF